MTVTFNGDTPLSASYLTPSSTKRPFMRCWSHSPLSAFLSSPLTNILLLSLIPLLPVVLTSRGTPVLLRSGLHRRPTFRPRPNAHPPPTCGFPPPLPPIPSDFLVPARPHVPCVLSRTPKTFDGWPVPAGPRLRAWLIPCQRPAAGCECLRYSLRSVPPSTCQTRLVGRSAGQAGFLRMARPCPAPVRVCQKRQHDCWQVSRGKRASELGSTSAYPVAAVLPRSEKAFVTAAPLKAFRNNPPARTRDAAYNAIRADGHDAQRATPLCCSRMPH
ncbi:hypothetical protein Baya_14927 [Bagarius yarrelli]|uniref:Uncharacterized protein n=1 Tax=Bagarius yarrelli TaxID=175774 RepID=A0A556VA87_BAGYA|nr:hypothetical protein Baya_14927 [Bagarius yarrelli]